MNHKSPSQPPNIFQSYSASNSNLAREHHKLLISSFSYKPYERGNFKNFVVTFPNNDNPFRNCYNYSDHLKSKKIYIKKRDEFPNFIQE